MKLPDGLDVPKQAVSLETSLSTEALRGSPSSELFWLGLIYGVFIRIGLLIKIDISKTLTDSALMSAIKGTDNLPLHQAVSVELRQEHLCLLLLWLN